MSVSAVFIAVTLFQMPDLVQAMVTTNDSSRSPMGVGGRNLAKLCVKMDCHQTSTEIAHRPQDTRGSNGDTSVSDGKPKMRVSGPTLPAQGGWSPKFGELTVKIDFLETSAMSTSLATKLKLLRDFAMGSPLVVTEVTWNAINKASEGSGNTTQGYELCLWFGYGYHGSPKLGASQQVKRIRYPLGYTDKRRIHRPKGQYGYSTAFRQLCTAVGLVLLMQADVVSCLFNRVVAIAKAVPSLLLVSIVFTALLPTAEAVVCMSCHDGVPGCTGGAGCPFFTTPMINSVILGSNAGTHTDNNGVVTTLLVCAAILPRAISRFLTRGVLDFFKSVARRAGTGAPLALHDLTAAEIVEAVRGGRVEIPEAISEILGRLPTAAQAEATRLNSIVSALGQLERVGAPSAGTGTAANGELWGAFTYAWTQAGRVVQFANESLVQAGGPEGEDTNPGQSERRAVKAAKILRPRSVHEFYHMLSVWQMICQGVSLANSLATGAFLEQVVHDQIAKNNLTWQQAHELFLVYLEAIETAPEGSNLTIANVYASGAHDMYRERAMLRAKEHFKGAPSGAGGDRDKDIFRTDACTYIGQTSSGRPCTTYNLGKPNSQHPTTALDHTGRCKFAHKCDQWVTEQSDGTKGGICGSWKHCRANCTNPKKSATKVDA
jgi:hypothetical protein